MSSAPPKRRDEVLLLVAALLVCVCARAFWRFAGEQGFALVNAAIVVGLLVDNLRLRRRVGRKS
jgi:hypothetical protein